VRYYALRIPCSIIHELHQRDFTALQQPADELAVNDTVEAVGFDFIRTPELEYECGVSQRDSRLLPEAFIRIKRSFSNAMAREMGCRSTFSFPTNCRTRSTRLRARARATYCMDWRRSSWPKARWTAYWH
jgi:hypothetical protein